MYSPAGPENRPKQSHKFTLKEGPSHIFDLGHLATAQQHTKSYSEHPSNHIATH